MGRPLAPGVKHPFDVDMTKLFGVIDLFCDDPANPQVNKSTAAHFKVVLDHFPPPIPPKSDTCAYYTNASDRHRETGSLRDKFTHVNKQMVWVFSQMASKGYTFNKYMLQLFDPRAPTAAKDQASILIRDGVILQIAKKEYDRLDKLDKRQNAVEKGAVSRQKSFSVY